jgi:hypothetical protein
MGTDRKAGGMTSWVSFVKPYRYGLEICLLFFAERSSVIRKTLNNSTDVRGNPVCN